MKLLSEAWTNGDAIPARLAAGRRAFDGVEFSDNLSPQLAWSGLPANTRSLVLICHDFDAPDRRAARPGGEIPPEAPRQEFIHWVLVDIDPALGGFLEGQWSRGFTARGKPGPQAAHGARQGLNDYTRWFAGDPGLAGRYFGYDGPFPPADDALIHHYVFTLHALAESRLSVHGDFVADDVRRAMDGRVLAEATLSGTYTLNRRLLGDPR